MAPSEKVEAEGGATEQVEDAAPAADMAVEGEAKDEAEGGEQEGADVAMAGEDGKDAPAEDGKDAPAEEPKDAPAEEPKDEKPPAPEEPKELEQDAEADGRAKIAAGCVQIGQAPDSTLNVMPTCGGKVLMSMTDGGFQHLVAAARANAGVKSGRYMYEVRILESKVSAEQGKVRVRQTCSIGFSTSGSSLFFGDGDSNIAFDSDGNFVAGGKWSDRRLTQRFEQDTVYGVLLNLDENSPNAHTVSLFANGERLCKPQPLPESMKGKALFPTVNYKNMTLNVNFGPDSTTTMPFACRMLQDAAEADVEMAAAVGSPGDKPEVLFPTGLPDEGTFDWLDDFLKKNPAYTELSNRSILDWGVKSGLYRGRNSWACCGDKPAMDFGIREFDEGTLKDMVLSLAAMVPRNYVVMEVQNNLLKDARAKSLAVFGADFNKVAMVVMGEPPASVKQKAHDQILQEKRKKVAAETRRKKVAEQVERRKEKRRLQEEAEEKKRAAKAKKEAEKKEREAKKKAEGEEAEGDKAEEKEEEVEEEEETNAVAEEPEIDVDAAVQEAEDAVELTEEEKATWFPKRDNEDLSKRDLGHYFAQFSAPDKTEGFDDVRYEWKDAAACQQYLKAWISQRKLTTRMEDLLPGGQFDKLWADWESNVQEWRRKQNDRRDTKKRPEKKRRVEEKTEEKTEAAAEETKKEEDADMKKEEGAEKKEEEGAEKKEEEGAEKKDEDQEKKGDGEEKKEETKEESKEEPKEEEEEEETKEIDFDSVDPFLVDDIYDVGNGQALFAYFTWEDWMMLSLRYELHLLSHSFKADVKDDERPAFHESHLGFYYNKYFKKHLSVKTFGVNTNLELMALVKDTMEVVTKTSILDPQLSEDTPLENFIRLTEDHRRERQRLYDVGDETAVLHLQRPQHSGGGQYGRGSDRGRTDRGNQSYRNDRAPHSSSGGYSSRSAPMSSGGYQGGGGGYQGRGQDQGYQSRGGMDQGRGAPAQSSRYGGQSAPIGQASRGYAGATTTVGQPMTHQRSAAPMPMGRDSRGPPMSDRRDPRGAGGYPPRDSGRDRYPSGRDSGFDRGRSPTRPTQTSHRGAYQSMPQSQSMAPAPYGGQKRDYGMPPAPSQGQPPYKQQRTGGSSYGAPAPSRGSSAGGGYGGGYGRR